MIWRQLPVRVEEYQILETFVNKTGKRCTVTSSVNYQDVLEESLLEEKQDKFRSTVLEGSLSREGYFFHDDEPRITKQKIYTFCDTNKSFGNFVCDTQRNINECPG